MLKVEQLPTLDVEVGAPGSMQGKPVALTGILIAVVDPWWW